VNIPDYISAVVGYRVWRWTSKGLQSFNGEVWPARHPLAAHCRLTACRLPPHDPPHFECSCGVYAGKDIAHLRNCGYTERGILGEVHLWGTVVEHKLGWRGQFAYPKSLFLTSDQLPFTLAELIARMRTLTVFGADLLLMTDSERVLLWRSGSGYDSEGLDYLLKTRKEYYERLLWERTLKAGDRVALRGRGIAVVVSTDEESVIAMLRGRFHLRIARRDVVLNKNYMRWECDGAVAENAREDQTA